MFFFLFFAFFSFLFIWYASVIVSSVVFMHVCCLYFNKVSVSVSVQYTIHTEAQEEWASTSHRRNVCLRHCKIHRCVHSWWRPLTSTNTSYNNTFGRYGLDFLPLTLKTISAMPTYTMNICDTFHWNPSTEWRDIASREIGVHGQRTDGRTNGRKTQCLRRLLLAEA